MTGPTTDPHGKFVKPLRFNLSFLLVIIAAVAIAVLAIKPVRNYIARREQQRKLDEYYSLIRPQLEGSTKRPQPTDRAK